MSRIIILNAPPDAGKDVAAEYIEKTHGFTHLRFKDRLVEITRTIFGVDDNDWNSFYTRTEKEVPQDLLWGRSPRNSLIHVSENTIKPNFGDDYFGKALSRAALPHDKVIVSDGGFVSEVIPIISDHGAENIMIIQIHREGRNFDFDSRAFLPHDGALSECRFETVYNDGTLEEFYKKIENLCLNFCEG